MRTAELRCLNNEYGHDEVEALANEIRSQLGLADDNRTVEYKNRGFGHSEPVIRVKAENGAELDELLDRVAVMLPAESERWEIRFFVKL